MAGWLVERLANVFLAAFLAALKLLRRRGYAWFLSVADDLRERARDCWWRYKLKTILSEQDPDDDMLADGLGKLWKFESPPAWSRWRLELRPDGTKFYVPEPGSGYIMNHHGEYLPAK